jgi:hypothetical protein
MIGSVSRAGTVSTSTPTERSASGVGSEENVIAIGVEEPSEAPEGTRMPSGNTPSGLGAFDGVVETPRIWVTRTTSIPEERCRRVDLGHAGHRAIDRRGWAGREQKTNESNPRQ